MSAKRLHRELGVVLCCNLCDATLQTANVVFKHNRKWAASLGWGRGLRKGHRRRDLCPVHFTEEKAYVAELKRKRDEKRAARDAKRKAAA